MIDRAVVEQFGLHGRPARFLLGLAGLFAIFTLPPFTGFTHVGAASLSGLWLALASWMLTVHRCCYRRALDSRAAFYVLVFGNVMAGIAITLLLVVLSRTPETPLWLAYCVMACINGATESQPSILLGMLHVAAPLATTPVFLAIGASRAWGVTGPLICSLISGYGYLFLARRGQLWRQERHERELRAAEARLHASECERERLGRDLHDTVGTALSLVALYGTLVQDGAEDPAHARQLAATIRDAARVGLDDLRGVLLALPHAPITVQQLADGLAMVTGRAARSAGAALRVDVHRGGSVVLSGELRVALVRTFQELVHNALRHGSARRIDASLDADADSVALIVADDGVGFDPHIPGGGTGLAGARSRAGEIGGRFEVASCPGQGTRVQLTLPRARGEAAR